ESGSKESDRAEVSVTGDAGVHECHLQRQDGDADDERDELRGVGLAHDQGEHGAAQSQQDHVRAGGEDQPPPMNFKDALDQLSMASTIASLCNASSIKCDPKRKKYLKAQRSTDPANTAHFINNHWHSHATVLAKLEINRDRKSIFAVAKPADKKWNQLLFKGVPEGLLPRCTKALQANGKKEKLDKAGTNVILVQSQRMAGHALRVLALAYKDLSGPLASYGGTPDHAASKVLSEDTSAFMAIERDLTFVGLPLPW
ncbi:hypothetical protein ACHAWF_015371, partial [Thalassiosira exigua]